MPSAFQYAHASDNNAGVLFDELASQLQPPFNATLGFVYVTDVLDDQLPIILNQLTKITDITNWVGTVGHGIIGGDTEYYDVPAVSVLLCDIPEQDYTLIPNLTHTVIPFMSGKQQLAADHEPALAVLHGDPANPNIPALLSELQQKINNTELLGGLTSSRGIASQFTGDIVSGGLSGVLFTSRVATVSNLSQGCTPISPVYQVTDSERNLLVSLDNKPALEVFKQSIGEVLARDISRAAGFIFAGLPTESDNPDDYMVRNIIGADEEHQLVAIGENVDAGKKILFCRRDGNTAQAELKRMLDEMKNTLNATPRGGIYISCIARGKHQFGENSEEVSMIKDTLGEFPLIGFYANGEIFNAQLYAFTGILILFV